MFWLHLLGVCPLPVPYPYPPPRFLFLFWGHRTSSSHHGSKWLPGLKWRHGGGGGAGTSDPTKEHLQKEAGSAPLWGAALRAEPQSLLTRSSKLLQWGLQ